MPSLDWKLIAPVAVVAIGGLAFATYFTAQPAAEQPQVEAVVEVAEAQPALDKARSTFAIPLLMLPMILARGLCRNFLLLPMRG